MCKGFAYWYSVTLYTCLTGPPTITRYDPLEINLNPRAGTTVTLLCEAEGDPVPTIRWLYNGGYNLPTGAQTVGNQLM